MCLGSVPPQLLSPPPPPALSLSFSFLLFLLLLLLHYLSRSSKIDPCHFGPPPPSHQRKLHSFPARHVTSKERKRKGGGGGARHTHIDGGGHDGRRDEGTVGDGGVRSWCWMDTQPSSPHPCRPTPKQPAEFFFAWPSSHTRAPPAYYDMC